MSKLKSRLNENMDYVKLVKSKLRQNDGYCPCKIEHSKDNKCPCKEFREQDYVGECHCGLYRKVEA